MAVVFAGGIVLASAGEGEPVEDVRLLSGAAWLSSSSVGQVTLLDGSAAEVAAQVQVAPAGTDLDVEQQGSTAFAINQSTRTLRRVDGGTFALSPPEQPIPDAKGDLAVFPGPAVLYTLDGEHGVLASNDPRSLAPRGELMSLASELAAGSAVVDGAGSLWAVDAGTGDLTYVVDGKRTVRRQVIEPGRSKLAIAGGHPVVVDVDRRRALKIDRTNGRPGTAFDLDLRASDTVEVSGSVHASRLYLVAGRGVLTVCDLSADTCDKTVPLDTGSTYGPAVEAGDQVFVPDYTTGQVWIIDLAKSRVVAKPTVLSPAVRFQLFARDGVVFYNDANSERAGVIQLDGTVVSVAKYDPSNPAKGLTGQVRGASQAQLPGQPSQPQSGAPSQTPNQTPGRRDQPSQGVLPSQPGQTLVPGQTPTGGQAGDPFDPGQPSQPGGSQPPGQSSSSSSEPTTSETSQTTTTPPAPEPRLAVTMSTATPTENQPVTLQVSNTNGDQPVSAQWTFGDGGQGSGVTTSHQWQNARATPYLVTVTATLPDGRTAMTTVNVTVSETPRVRLTVNIPGGGGTVSGGGINCPGTCFVDVLPDTQITLTARPDAAHLVGQWSGGCGGSASTCDVTVRGPTSVSHSFELRPAPKARLTASAPANGSITGSVNCPGGCSAEFGQGTQVTLNAVAASGFQFGSWGGACAGQGARCSLTMTGDLSVSATFSALPAPVISSLTCDTLGRATFRCTVGFTPSGGTIRWTVNGVAESDDNDKTQMSGRCTGQSLLATVKVVVSNPRGSAEKSSTVKCEGGS